ncbi:transcriptional regulator [Helicobacter cappadocius]|uniref:Transcriptional regulator n=1 Tax=Helicobacter cappadocius TaxID=3063998 RepID=A0AA90TBJ9_9HELI|nr:MULTISPECIES: transcriptional regulator [unclassified Helicobacter]MDO7252793.1 transcriptional regulator [Helicobacter sp. faydin-H75]MDP2538836.1 transcriptional regulator [Helicobacter sp. faydin-H76]
MSNEQNLIKKTAKELGMTYKELGIAIGYSEAGLKTAMTNDKISPQMERAIELYLETLELKKELQKTKDFKNILREFISEN